MRNGDPVLVRTSVCEADSIADELHRFALYYRDRLVNGTEAIVDGLGADRFARDLPGGLRVRTRYGKMFISHEGPARQLVAPSLLEVPGIAHLGEQGAITAEPADPDTRDTGPASVVIDADRATGPLVVDGPREGDRMRPLGMEGTRKLSDILGEAKIPREERGTWPIVRDGDEVVWVAGLRLSDDYKVTPRTSDAVRLTWDRGA